MSKKKDKLRIRRGDVVTLDLETIKDYSDEDKQKYYWYLGYGEEKPRMFVFITRIYSQHEWEHRPGKMKKHRVDSGHCVLMDMDTQKLVSMAHTVNLRHAEESEF